MSIIICTHPHPHPHTNKYQRVVLKLLLTMSVRTHIFPCLRVLLAHRGQKVMNEFTDEAPRVVNSSDKLRDDLKPSVNINCSNPFHEGFVNVL